MARTFFSYARRSMEVCGFTVDDGCIAEDCTTFCELPLVPFSKAEKVFNPKDHRMIIAIGFIRMNDLREAKFREAKEKGYLFASYIHDSVMIHDGVVINENCIILDHTTIAPDTKIGTGTFISSNVSIGHGCDIKSFNWINSGVTISGECYIGSGCFFGVNSSTGHGVRIGSQNFIAANTLINRDTNENEVYISEPGQLFRLKSKAFLEFRKILG